MNGPRGLCATSVRTRQRYVVPDARTDAQQKDNPQVIEDTTASALSGTAERAALVR